MIDLQPAPVPVLSEEWIASHQTTLVAALSQRRRRPLKWVTLAGATAAAATVSSLVLVGGSEQFAFAGWSPSPTPPASGQLTSADAGCQAHLAQVPPASDKGADAASLVPELSDVRGPYTVTVFGNATGSGALLCITTPDGNSALRWLMQSGAPVTAGAIAVDQVSVLARESQPYTLVEGRTGDGVTGVTLVLGNGSEVTATSGNGAFIAWWPGSETITSGIVSTATGVSTQTIDLPGPGIPSSPKSPPPSSPPGTQTSCIPSADVACSIGTAGPS
ncbi:MAG TPA: hypothetical protein VMR97_10085 [Acidimicrobiales bacterium]|nr:hypothetical protein [Acidimicrobiales bacterium]